MPRRLKGSFVDDRTFKRMLELLQLEVAATYSVAHLGARLGLRLELTIRSVWDTQPPSPFWFVSANTLFRGRQQAHPRPYKLEWPKT